jgi:SAM-dependent methyltransferase
MQTLADVFDQLGEGPAEHEIYTTLAPLYRAMYVARGRIKGQLETVEAIAQPGASDILEIGCGTGDLLHRLETAFEHVIGADPSPTMAQFAAERCRHVCRADARAFRPGSVDVAVLLGAVLGHIRPDRTGKETLSHVRRTLRPGGRVVCSVHRQLKKPRSRELTRSVDKYDITQRDEQRPTEDGSFKWAVTFELTAHATGETRQVSSVTPIRAFAPDELVDWFHQAGLVNVETHPREYVGGSGEEDRAFIAVGECPPS